MWTSIEELAEAEATRKMDDDMAEWYLSMVQNAEDLGMVEEEYHRPHHLTEEGATYIVEAMNDYLTGAR